MSKNEESSNQKITVNQLEPGMYVLSVRTKGKSVNVKSEGYISSKENIQKLIKAGITHLTVDPSRQKKAEKTDKILPEIKENSANQG